MGFCRRAPWSWLAAGSVPVTSLKPFHWEPRACGLPRGFGQPPWCCPHSLGRHQWGGQPGWAGGEKEPESRIRPCRGGQPAPARGSRRARWAPRRSLALASAAVTAGDVGMAGLPKGVGAFSLCVLWGFVFSEGVWQGHAVNSALFFTTWILFASSGGQRCQLCLVREPCDAKPWF